MTEEILFETLCTIYRQTFWINKCLHFGALVVFLLHVLVDFFAVVEFVIELKNKQSSETKQFLYMFAIHDMSWYAVLTINALLNGNKPSVARFLFGGLQVYLLVYHWKRWSILFWPYQCVILTRILSYILFQNLFCPLTNLWHSRLVEHQRSVVRKIEKLPKGKRLLKNFRMPESEKTFLDWLVGKFENLLQK